MSTGILDPRLRAPPTREPFFDDKEDNMNRRYDNAQASADLSSTAQFITLRGGGMPQSAAAENAWTPRGQSAQADGAGESAADIAAALIANLPFTGTSSIPMYGGGLLLIGAGLAILFRSRKTS
jgi:hypothetical protein